MQKLCDWWKASTDTRLLVLGIRSAGQRQRADLILFLTLHGLYRARAACRFSWLFLDEALDYLDIAGQRSVLRWLADSCGAQLTMIVSQHPARSSICAGHNVRNIDVGSMYSIRLAKMNDAVAQSHPLVEHFANDGAKKMWKRASGDRKGCNKMAIEHTSNRRNV